MSTRRESGHPLEIKLREMGACKEACAWIRDYQNTQEAWAGCQRGDHMLWYIGRTVAGKPWSDTRRPLVMAACACARLALPYATGDTARVAIETAEAWVRGSATPEEVRDAATRAAAYAADDTRYQPPTAAAYAYAAAAAAWAAEAAAYVLAADAAANAAANTAAAAAANAGAKASDADASAAVTSARTRTLCQCADIVRRYYAVDADGNPVVLPGAAP